MSTALRLAVLFILGGNCFRRARAHGGAVLLASLVFNISSGRSEEALAGGGAEQELKLHISWGHTSRGRREFYVAFQTNNTVLEKVLPESFEAEDTFRGGVCRTRAGNGDVDGVVCTLRYPEAAVQTITNSQTIWRYLISHSDSDTAKRLRFDPGFRPDARKLTILLNADGTSGFTVTVDQLLMEKRFWVPALDIYLSVGEKPVSFEEHQAELGRWMGKRILDRVRRSPEASYAEYRQRWEDMGDPSYQNPSAPAPGHIVCVGWEYGMHKFGIDRWAGVRNDLGNADSFRFETDLGGRAAEGAGLWKGQALEDGLPVVKTRFERDGVEFEIEQFAYPLFGPPAEKRGDLPMVLLEKILLRNRKEERREVKLGFIHERKFASPTAALTVRQEPEQLLWIADGTGSGVLMAQGNGISLASSVTGGGAIQTNSIGLQIDLPARGTSQVVLKLPSPAVRSEDLETFGKLDYEDARGRTLKFWRDALRRGAQIEVPEEAVNELFRANLWHALRLPRLHGGVGSAMDLPYSNFAYDQRGAPWPVNQAVYVDYMLYDLRGYHEESAEDLRVIFRNNQEPSGRINGFANWGVYTPSMLYTVAQQYLLTGDRARFEAFLPQTLRALDWCLAELKRARAAAGPAKGLLLAPLNDLSHEHRAWAFNEAYLFAGIDLLGRALAQAGEPRAQECNAAARALREAVERGFGRASARSPLAQLRDHTWIPYVPSDAMASGRLMEVWYPTDVDTGALHLSRLGALDPKGALTDFLLNDHEDNLFLKGLGMANEPVYNQQATVYLERDDVKAAVRAFYSMMACAFSQTVFEPVEHRWAWGQYFGPPSTDGAWFDLYRHMLIHEREDDSLVLLQATPRAWLEDGKRIRVERAPTYYGLLSMEARSQAQAGKILVSIDMPDRRRPGELLVRLRHPGEARMRAVRVNGMEWKDFDPGKEWIRIGHPAARRYQIEVSYSKPLEL